MTSRAVRSRGMPRRRAVEPAGRTARAPLLIATAMLAVLVVAAIAAVALTWASPTGVAEPAVRALPSRAPRCRPSAIRRPIRPSDSRSRACREPASTERR